MYTHRMQPWTHTTKWIGVFLFKIPIWINSYLSCTIFADFPSQYVNNREYFTNNLPQQTHFSEPNNAVRSENNQFRRNLSQSRNLSPPRNNNNNNEYNPNNGPYNNSRNFMGETNDRSFQYRDTSCCASFIRYIKKIPSFSGQSHEDLINFIEICDTINALCINDSEYNEFITNIIFQVRGEARSAIVIFQISHHFG